MSSFERPADDRHDALLATAEASNRPHGEGAICPLMSGTVQLLPLRYGLVAEPPPPEAPVPYTLEAMPMGLRLMRNGYLYVLDGKTLELHEYDIKDHALADTGAIGGHNGGKLEYPTDRTLHVCFSEVAWTEAKRAQVRDSEADREAFMQAVNLAGAGPVHGGEHLIPPYRAATQVAEFAGRRLGGDADLYGWENEPYFHETRIGKLFEQHGVDEPDECLCLLVRDDIGVMRDLAQLQDTVLEEVEAWAEEDDGRTRRDYVLASYIDSLITINEDRLQHLAGNGDEAAISLVDDTSAAQRQTIYDHLVARRDHRGPLPMGDESHWREARYADNDYVQTFLAMREALGDALYDKHRELINLLNLDTFHTLNGRGLGQRGINQLIDRAGMERVLETEGEALARWSALLDDISHDRAVMLSRNRFHLAAWYFDPQDEEQMELAFEAQRACTRDICRNDDGIDLIGDWLEAHPEYDRPLFHTLSHREQAEMAVELSNLASASYGMGTRSVALLEDLEEWAGRLHALERDRLPDIAELPDDIRATAILARENLSPAVSRGISRVLVQLAQAAEGAAPLPPLEEIFRDLPKVLGHRLMSAAREGRLTFLLADDDALGEFRRLLQRTLNARLELARLNSRLSQLRDRNQHKTHDYTALQRERRSVQERLTPLEEQLARSISAVEALPEGAEMHASPVDDSSAGKARAGVTVVAGAGGVATRQLQQAGGMIRNLRLGYQSAPPLAKGGDALSLLVFMAQAVNLWAVIREADELTPNDPLERGEISKLWQAFTGTAAAGFLAAQAIGHTALSSHAQTLAQSLGERASATQRVYSQIGRLHLLVGFAGYLFGFIAALNSLGHDFSQWQAALRNGNRTAQYGALTAVGGSAGLAGSFGYGLQRTTDIGIAVLRRRITLEVAGRYLGQVLARFNALGLVFSLLQLSGTWVYNRYNLDRHDRWLQTSPWGSDNRDASLEAYTEELNAINQAMHITLVRRDDGHHIGIVLPSLPGEALQAPLGGQPSVRVSCQAWQIRPEPRYRRAGPGPERPGELWVAIGDEFGPSLRLLSSAGSHGVAIRGTMPSRRFAPEHYAVAVRLEWLDERGEYRAGPHDVQVIYVDPSLGSGPGSHYQPTGDVTAPLEPGGWYAVDPRTLVMNP